MGVRKKTHVFGVRSIVNKNILDHFQHEKNIKQTKIETF